MGGGGMNSIDNAKRKMKIAAVIQLVSGSI